MTSFTAKGIKRAGDKRYGRAAMSNDRLFSDDVPSNSKRWRRVRTLMTDYIRASGDTSALALDFYRSAALIQWEIDALEAAPELDIAKHRALINQRQGLLRQAGVLSNPSHHDVPALPRDEGERAPVETQAAKSLADLCAAVKKDDAPLDAPEDGEPNDDQT